MIKTRDSSPKSETLKAGCEAVKARVSKINISPALANVGPVYLQFFRESGDFQRSRQFDYAL
jgi:hypothetical protein